MCDKVIESMRESYQKGILVPFVGAGFSKNIEGYPDWEGFVEVLDAILGESRGFLLSNFQDDMLEATEYFIMQQREFDRGKISLWSEVRNQFKGIKYDSELWDLHEKLVNAKRIRQIFTTNWDDALETACEQTGRAFTKVVGRDDLRSYAEHTACEDPKELPRLLIVKYHGDCREPDPKFMVACETDYYNRMLMPNHLDIKLKNELLYNDFVLLGYSLRDINVKYVISQMNFLKAEMNPKPPYEDKDRKLFFVTPVSPEEARMRLLSQWKGMTVLYLPDILKQQTSGSQADVRRDGKPYRFVYKRAGYRQTIRITKGALQLSDLVGFDRVAEALKSKGREKDFNIRVFKKKYEAFRQKAIRDCFGCLFGQVFDDS
jgi:hypothetical protein